MGLDGQVGVKTRELENVFFFFHFKDHYLSFFFRRCYKFTLFSVASVLGWPGGKISEGAEAIISRSPISPPISFPGLTLKRG